MIEELVKLMKVQSEDLKELLALLETQNKMIMEKDVFGLEGLVDKLTDCSKKIAQEEIQRRNLIGEESLKVVVSQSNDEQLKESYSHIQEILNKVISQKDTNDMLLKQQLLFNNKMIQIINPNREAKTYNSYGNIGR